MENDVYRGPSGNISRRRRLHVTSDSSSGFVNVEPRLAGGFVLLRGASVGSPFAPAALFEGDRSGRRLDDPQFIAGGETHGLDNVLGQSDREAVAPFRDAHDIHQIAESRISWQCYRRIASKRHAVALGLLLQA